MNKKMTKNEIKNMPESTIGQRLHKCRKEKQLTQETFAEMLGCDTRTINRYENDKSYPSAENIGYISELLGTTVGYIVNGTSQKDAEAEISTINEYLQLMSHEQLVFIEHFLQLYLQNHSQS